MLTIQWWTEGVVLAVESGDESKLKPIDCCLDEEPILTEKQLRLAAFLRERYFCTVYDCVKAMLPAGLYFSLKDSLILKENLDRETIGLRNILVVATLLQTFALSNNGE